MTEITRYSVRFYGADGFENGIRAQVHLFDQANKLVGWMNFHDKADNLPADKSEKPYVMSLPISRLEDVVDVLRNEKPIFFDWQARIERLYFGTSQEPVGEGE